VKDSVDEIHPDARRKRGVESVVRCPEMELVFVRERVRR
jgi:hypothetical protein